MPFYQYLWIILNLVSQSDVELLSNIICQSDTLGTMGRSSENTFILTEESAITCKSFCIKDKRKVSLTCLMEVSNPFRSNQRLWIFSFLTQFPLLQIRGETRLNAGNMIKFVAGKIYMPLAHVWRLPLCMLSKSIYARLTCASWNEGNEDLGFLRVLLKPFQVGEKSEVRLIVATVH